MRYYKYNVSIVGGKVDSPYHGSIEIEAGSLLEAFQHAIGIISVDSNTFIVEINKKQDCHKITGSRSFILTVSSKNQCVEVLMKADSIQDALHLADSLFKNNAEIVGIVESDD